MLIKSAFGGNLFAQEGIQDIYRIYLGLLWHYTKLTCGNELPDLLSEPSIGNPIPCSLRGKLISQDLANSIRECTAALAPLGVALPGSSPVSVVEIGAGYGRVGFVMLSSMPCRYTVVDIPPALALSQWYLTSVFPDKRAFHFRPWKNFHDVQSELDSSDICFMTPDQFALCPDKYFDVGITISTLTEMSREQVDFYLSRLAATVSKVIYIKQWTQHDNKFDGNMLHQSDFVLPPPWQTAFERPDDVMPEFFEKSWLRS